MNWKNITFYKYYLASIISNLLSSLCILIIRGFLPPVVPLYYGQPIGSEQLAPNIFLFIIPATSLLITVINIIISKSVNDEFMKKLLAIASLVISLMSIVTLVKIIMLVGFFK